MLECVPNFSEGRDKTVVEAIAQAVRLHPVALLGYEMDSDHHRSVFTFAGKADDVVEAAVAAVGVAAERIDLRGHVGIHPRVGAADVVPFVPLAGASMQDAVDAAHAAGREIWKRWGVPVYFYAAAAQRETRQRLEQVRRLGFDGFPPDVGDITHHATAGASVVGARPFLLAYNVDLKTTDVSIAREIARRVRASSGGFPYVKAMGLYLASRDRAQVSMNLTNHREIPLGELMTRIDASARELGTSIADGEVIGFVPQEAYDASPDFFHRASNFDESRLLERHLKSI
jgi:glutamate formiminotransferase